MHTEQKEHCQAHQEEGRRVLWSLVQTGGTSAGHPSLYMTIPHLSLAFVMQFKQAADISAHLLPLLTSGAQLTVKEQLVDCYDILTSKDQFCNKTTGHPRALLCRLSLI